MEGFQVVTIERVVHEVDIFVSATGNFNIITLEHMKGMKNNAIVGNIGHLDNEVDMKGVEGMEGVRMENIKPQVDRFVFPDGHGVIILASGRLLNLGLQQSKGGPARKSGAASACRSAVACLDHACRQLLELRIAPGGCV